MNRATKPPLPGSPPHPRPQINKASPSAYKTPDYIVISVESQKGGVGKTTAALNLARLLLKRDRNPYRVLFFDLDIAGTEAATIKDSPLWREDINVVTFRIPKEGHSVSERTESNNLVELYDDFMSGSAIPPFEWKDTGKATPSPLVFDPDKLNILSSCLAKAHGGQRLHLHGPQVLFDEAHAAWFLDMIRGIITVAEQTRTERPLAVVIDTSPGFSGLGPNVEDWLTDLGPERGKFLFVASADQQDITACMYAINRVEDAFRTKLTAAKRLLETRKATASEEVLVPFKASKNDEKRFFMRLLGESPYQSGKAPEAPQTLPLKAHTLDSLRWYLGASEDELTFRLSQLSRSWAMLHSRVPPVLLEDQLGAELWRIVPDLGDETLAAIVRSCRENIRAHSIAYSSEYALQFVFCEFIEKGRGLPRSASLSEDNGLEHFPPPRFSSGTHFLRYIVALHCAFCRAAQRAAITQTKSIRFSFMEFSPGMLYTKQLNRFPWGGKPLSLETVDQDGLTESAIEAYAAFKALYRQSLKDSKQLKDSIDLSWIERALLVACAIRHVLYRKEGTPVSLLPWLEKALLETRVVMRRLEDLPFIGKRWPLAQITLDKQTLLAIVAVSKEGTGRFGGPPVSSLLTSFIAAYNHALRAGESVILMQTTAECARSADNSALSLVFAESLLRHVVLQQDMPLGRATTLLKTVGADKTEDPQKLLQMFLNLKTMDAFANVLRPILGPDRWSII